MQTVGSYEAKTNLSKLLDNVISGERIVITRHGKPIAVLIPPVNKQKNNISRTISEIHDFQKTHSLGNNKIQEMIGEGRKY